MFYNHISIALNLEEWEKLKQIVSENKKLTYKEILFKGIEAIDKEKGIADEPADAGKVN